jgi:TIR domain
MAASYDLFISYTQKDGEIAASLATQLHDAGVTCFMADRSILAAAEWEPTLREALRSSKSVLLLMTPRSKASLWVAAEAGAAWVLQKELIPVLMFVDPGELFEPLRKFQARVAETPQQLHSLVNELASNRQNLRRKLSEPLSYHFHELFNTPQTWERLVKVGKWQFEQNSGAIMSEGMYRYLLSDFEYGTRTFKIDARIEFVELRAESAVNAVNAGIVLGWNASEEKPRYLHLMFSGRRLLLEQIGQSGGDEYYDFRHIDEGVPFLLQTGQSYEISLGATEEVIAVSIDGREVYSVRPPKDALAGKVGLRPWRSVLKCDRFEVRCDTRNRNLADTMNAP